MSERHCKQCHTMLSHREMGGLCLGCEAKSELAPAPGAPFVVTQRMVDQIVTRAQNSDMGLNPPDKGRRSYNIDQYEPPNLRSLAILLVSAHFSKWDIISIVAAALEIVAEESRKANDQA